MTARTTSAKAADFGNMLRTRPYMFAAFLSLALLIANIIAEPSFGAPSNMPQQLATLAPFVLAAIASTPAILSGNGGLDISIGPLLTFINIIMVVWLVPHGLGDVWIALPLLLLVGAAIGAVNGLLVAVLRYQPVIATLCVFFVLIGVNQLIADQPKHAADNFTNNLTGTFLHIPMALLLPALIAALWYGLSRTPYHRALYAIGASDTTAYSAGIDVRKTRVIAYGLGGLFAACAGIALTGLVQQADAAVSLQYTLIAFAAVALGGTQLGVARGGLIGSTLGACAIYLLQTLLSALHVAPTWLNVVYGGLLIVGVVVGAQSAAVPARKAAAS
jgi:ribose transport system permease protein